MVMPVTKKCDTDPGETSEYVAKWVSPWGGKHWENTKAKAAESTSYTVFAGITRGINP